MKFEYFSGTAPYHVSNSEESDAPRVRFDYPFRDGSSSLCQQVYTTNVFSHYVNIGNIN